ncbi:hypothetical protein ACFPIJ_32870 [Dactylosporangium cerinum]|uniref:Uncharacterized protein n=1 Tax=Dactylosporangium cerinum TaxID=1434730 RepID=A0ABV9W5L9_9ACTN
MDEVEQSSRMLGEAVMLLYESFAGYPLREWTDPCLHCHTADEEQALHRVPLRDLTPNDLERYVADSLMLWGDLGDLKHFLPRILEIAATEGFEFPDVEIVYGHLAYGAFATWPAAEQAAVRDLAMAHWRTALAEGVHLAHFEPVLTGIMLIEDDLSSYLRHWERSGDAVTLANLAEYAREIARIRRGERVWNAFLEVGRPGGAYGTVRPGPGQVTDWLARPDLLARLAARRGTLPDPPAEAALEEALKAVGELSP